MQRRTFLPVVVSFIAAALAAVGNARAQDAGSATNKLKDEFSQFVADLSIPASPASVLAGFAPDKVIQPRTRREFEVALSGLLSNGGRPSGALEFAPYFIAAGGKLKFNEYTQSPGLRAATKTSVGIAAGTREVEDKKFSAQAFSLTSVLIDLADPIYHHKFMACVQEVQDAEIERQRKQPVGAVTPLPAAGSRTRFSKADEVTSAEAKEGYASCIEQLGAATWNRTKLAVGVSYGKGREAEGAKRDVALGRSAWVTFQYGFEPFNRIFNRDALSYDCETPAKAQEYPCREKEDNKPAKLRRPSDLELRASLTLHARRTTDTSDLSQTATGPFLEFDSSLLGARFTYGAPRRSAHLEASMSKVSGLAGSKKNVQYGFGASYQVMKDLWLNLAAGRRKEFINDRLDTVVAMNLQFGSSSKAVFGQDSRP